MKKYIGIAFVLITILSLTACGSNSSNKKINLPKAEGIKEIEIMKTTSEESLKIENQDEISSIIEGIKENTNDTGRESVNDQPTNIKDYIIVKFHHKNAEGSPSLVYLYKDKNSSYVEQPYAGIWKLREETFDRITSNLTK
ncbi:conserved domain protein [Peptoniphilus sp. oral taxon 375 str. F0436]|nr:conserved domain protein [Peptoniphilus sp. oral taxon 375 str. F0436]